LAVLALASATLPVPAPARETADIVPAAVTSVPVYLAVDLSSHQVLAEREADHRFLPASMTTVMTAYVAFELIRQGKLSPEQRFTVIPATAALWATRGTGMRLKAGEQVPVDMLLHGITTVSANDASVVLAECAAGSVANWTALMNAEARRLGMTASHFGTPNGWPDGGATRVSARDMVTLGTALIERHPELYARYFGKKSLTWNGVTGQNHDPILGVVPGADGIKTGHTREAGYNFLGTATRGGRRIMIVVGGARSEEQRATASRELLEWSFQARETVPLFARGAIVGQAGVQGGNARHVGLAAPAGANLTVVRGTRPKATTIVRYRGPLIAPIAKGAEVARLEIAVAGRVVNRVPLVAATSIAKAGPFDRLVNGVAGLLP
jgi:D-alanyl-D-alanine carboxypeptidase (penicillin-binding protein 5/6)